MTKAVDFDWKVNIMILILDGNSAHVAHVLKQKNLFGEKNRFVTALDKNLNPHMIFLLKNIKIF